MNLLAIQKIFNRAFWHSFSTPKLIFTFLTLIACGLLAVFCKGLVQVSGHGWIAMSLTFLPIFLSVMILMFASILIIRIYHDEIKERKSTLSSVLKKSIDVMISAAILALPLILIYLLFWLLMGVFFLLKEIPALGELISVIFAFAPFLLILASIGLSIIGFLILFFVTPAIALKGFRRGEIFTLIAQRVKRNLFGNLLLLFLSVVPLIIILSFLLIAAFVTNMSYLPSGSILSIVLEWFFIMVPFAFILSPAVVFFFNFAAESFVLLKEDS